MEWFFDGLGSELVVLAIGLLIGGGTGAAISYRVAIKKVKKHIDNSKVENKKINTGGGNFVGRDKNG